MLEPNPNNRIDYKGIITHKFFDDIKDSEVPLPIELINVMPKIKNIKHCVWLSIERVYYRWACR